MASGRIRQKGRTYAAMLAAVRELLAEGVTPTVEQAADRAEVSRTTAYRYFTNQRELLVACYPNLDAPSLLGANAPADPALRLDLVIDRISRHLIEYEPELRANLRLSLESPKPERGALPLRQGRAIAWIEDALAPLRNKMGKAKLHRLVLAIRAAIGIEPLVWLTDIAGLAREDAVGLMRDSARTLLRAGLAERGKAKARARTRAK